ncbi:MAG: hypothetical protein IJX75_04805 [Clostridia bacterium]|nr:hypothetical protein [Clostridia bacterium]
MAKNKKAKKSTTSVGGKSGKGKTKKIFKWVGIGLATVLAVGVVAGIATSAAKKTETKTLTAGDYVRYALDQDSGEIDAGGRGWLTTDKYHYLEGIKIDVVEDANITYALYYYTEDYKFMWYEEFDEEYDETETDFMLAQGAKYVRVTICPLDDADQKINVLEKLEYASRLEVTVRLSVDE